MINIYKLKFTLLQQEILRFLFTNAGKAFNQRQISKNLDVSQTAVSKSLPYLQKEELILTNKDKESKRIEIILNYKNRKVIQLKRIDNLRSLYESGLVDELIENFPGSTIILFGSYSYGEDTIFSDIDIAIIGTCEKRINLEKYKKILKKEVIINFYKDFKDIKRNLKENIFNGILLHGGIRL